jgi:hypothetical protein
VPKADDYDTPGQGRDERSWWGSWFYLTGTKSRVTLMDHEEERAFALKILRARIDSHQEALNRAHAQLETLLREKIELLDRRVKELEGMLGK